MLLTPDELFCVGSDTTKMKLTDWLTLFLMPAHLISAFSFVCWLTLCVCVRVCVCVCKLALVKWKTHSLPV